MRKHCICGNYFWPLTVATLLLLLQLGSGDQQAEDHRIQRRFMWQQMDNSVMSGIMGRMYSGAQAVKSMFSDFLPSTAGYAKTMMDFMPTETTRVKYIIRDPHTNKPVKIIKMRGSQKKVVKFIRPLPKPLVTEPTQLQYENRMRQLEKEQELIVEGKAPMSSDDALMNKYFKPKKTSSSSSNGNGNSNEIVTGKIMEYQSWKPVYKSGEQPSSFVTMRPQALTQLHTQITSSNSHHDHEQGSYGSYGGYSSHEQLPKPEKLVGHRPDLEEEDDDFEQIGDDNEIAKPKSHQYEVTEHTGEASGEVQSLAPMEGGFVPSKQYSSRSPSGSHTDNNHNDSPTHHISRPRQRGVIVMSTTSTTTTEAPNYPPAFLKKYREREATATIKPASKSRPKHHHHHHQHKEHPIHSDDNAPFNVSYALSTFRARLQEQQRLTKQEEHDAEMEAALVDAMKGDKWPTEVQQSTGDYLSSPIGPSAVAFEQPLKQPKPTTAAPSPPRSEYKRTHGNVRQRGSIKFSDNPSNEEV